MGDEGCLGIKKADQISKKKRLYVMFNMIGHLKILVCLFDFRWYVCYYV